MSAVTDAAGNVAFSDHVVLTDHMRDGALSGLRRPDRQEWPAGRRQRRARGRHHGDRAPDRLQPLQDLQPAGPAHAGLAGEAERVVYDQVKHRIHFTDATLDLFGVPDPLHARSVGARSHREICQRPAGAGYRQFHQDRLFRPHSLLFRAVAHQRSDGGAANLQPRAASWWRREYRARWDNGGMWLQGSLAYNPNGGLGGNTGSQVYDHLFGSGRFALDMAGRTIWRAGFDTELTNNSAYMRFYDISYLDRLVNDLFIENVTGRSRFALTGYYFQGLRATDVQGRFPMSCRSWNTPIIPTGKVAGGRSASTSTASRCARQRPRQPAPHHRTELAAAAWCSAAASSGP